MSKKWRTKRRVKRKGMMRRNTRKQYKLSNKDAHCADRESALNAGNANMDLLGTGEAEIFE